MKFRVTIEPDEDGVFVAECPALPGCISQGKTRDEAMANIRDAIQGYVESLKKHENQKLDKSEASKLDDWEKQVDRDSNAGKLDHLLAELKGDIKAGRVKPLDEVINEP